MEILDKYLLILKPANIELDLGLNQNLELTPIESSSVKDFRITFHHSSNRTFPWVSSPHELTEILS